MTNKVGVGLFIAFVLFCAAGMGAALASSVQISCTDPVTRADGSPFDAATELKEYQWYVNGAMVQTTTSCNQFWLIAPTPDGTKDIQAVTIDTADRPSQQSPVTQKDFTTASPLPPVIN